MSWFEAEASASVIAFVTTVHAALLILRLHRSATPGRYLFSLPALAFCGLPWALGSPGWLLVQLGTHATWFTAVEKLAPSSPRGTPESKAGAPAPSVRGPSPARAPSPASVAPSVEVLSVHVENEAIRTFRFGRPPGFDFQAGQFLPVRVEIDGHPHVRCYSISSCPAYAGYLEISVRRQGLVSGWLHDHAVKGMQLSVRPPAGHFVYPSDSQRPIVLIAGGIGITPMLSMLRHGVTTEPTRPITLLYSVKHCGDLAFEDELTVLARRHRQARVVITLSDEHTGDRYRHGRIDEALLRSVVPDLMAAVYLMCGPTAMTDSLRALLLGLGVASDQVRSEVFTAAVAFGATAPPGSQAVGARSSCKLQFRASGIDTEAACSETLLDVAERVGADIPSLCRAGACGTCRTRLLSGDVEGHVDGTDDNRFVLPCVTRPMADCVLEA
jgi:ferredoxin-NADP reductase